MALVFDRDFEKDELTSFYRLPADEDPKPADFVIDDGRVVRYECEAADEPRWRLALEIFMVKALRDLPASRPRLTGIRNRAKLRKLHLG